MSPVKERSEETPGKTLCGVYSVHSLVQVLKGPAYFINKRCYCCEDSTHAIALHGQCRFEVSKFLFTGGDKGLTCRLIRVDSATFQQ
jgi:hypothetical protein